MPDRDCAICRGTGKYPASVDITGKLSDCPDCTPEPANHLRAALVAIQELHKPCKTFTGKEVCNVCNTETEKPITYPCKTRKLADEGLGGGQNV